MLRVTSVASVKTVRMKRKLKIKENQSVVLNPKKTKWLHKTSIDQYGHVGVKRGTPQNKLLLQMPLILMMQQAKCLSKPVLVVQVNLTAESDKNESKSPNRKRGKFDMKTYGIKKHKCEYSFPCPILECEYTI